mgnify:CR=1 FL=1
MSYKLTENARVRLASGEVELYGRAFKYVFRISLPNYVLPDDEEDFVKAEEGRLVERYRRQPGENYDSMSYMVE